VLAQRNFVAQNAYSTSSINRKFDYTIKRKYPALASIVNMPQVQKEIGMRRGEQL